MSSLTLDEAGFARWIPKYTKEARRVGKCALCWTEQRRLRIGTIDLRHTRQRHKLVSCYSESYTPPQMDGVCPYFSQTSRTIEGLWTCSFLEFKTVRSEASCATGRHCLLVAMADLSPYRSSLLSLYKNVMSLHRKKLPEQLRSIADDYVRVEFKTMKTVKKSVFVEEYVPMPLLRLSSGQLSRRVHAEAPILCPKLTPLILPSDS